MRDIKALGKQIGRDQKLASALWKTGVYEARMLASFVGDPASISAAEMERWCRSFDNWALCDALAFNLFDRTPHAWAKAEEWSGRREEFVKRTAFALVWSLSVHDKAAGDARFLRALEWIEREAPDERNFVKKAVSMALRATGKRNAALRKSALGVARQLAASGDVTARWVGREAVRELD